MKLTIALILIASLHVSANVYSQTTITLKFQSVELKKALAIIERHSSFRFLYNDETIRSGNRVSLDVKNIAVTKILDNWLGSRSLSYKILGNNLVVITSGNVDVVQAKVTGKITSITGEPLENVSVKIKGSTLGTQTGPGGTFSIIVPDNATLIISYVGYEEIQVPVNGRSEINIVLKPSEKVMDQVVVIGYGSATKRDLTGSIVKISGKDIADKPNTNPVASLQGRVAGLSVVNNGTPGAAPDVRIRGTVSIGQVHPLYIVDGIFNDNIDYLNPNDIESIEVLKDPSSLAIFGIRGATGAIAITTKKARAGQTVINFNTTYGFKKLVDKIKMVDGSQFKTLFAEENANNGITTPFDYTGLTANTDWIDAVTRTANTSSSNLSISGSTEKNRFNMGLGYTADQGIVRHEQLEKMLFSLSDEFRVNKAVKLGVNLNFVRQHLPYDVTGSGTDVLNLARKVVPLVSSGTKQFKVLDPYGTDSINANLYSGLNTSLQSSGVVNPLVQLENEWDKTINMDYRSVGSVYADVTFLKKFTFRSTFYADIDSRNKRQYTPLYYEYNPVNNTPYLATTTTKVQEDDHTARQFQQDEILTYKTTIREDHNITATAGFTTFYSGTFDRTGKSSQGTTATALPIPNDPRFWYVNNGFQDNSTTSATSSQSEYTTVSVLARVLYNYKSKYFLNASFRDDASSRMPAVNRWQQFWALGGAWEMSQEDFMKTQHIFDYLKIKGSIGVLGNQSAYDNLGNVLNYPFYPSLNTGQNAVFGTNVVSAARQSYIPNPDLKWETVAAQEIGFEFTALRNRLHFEANYYNKTTKDLMVYINRSALGLNNELQNAGSLRNWGEEFAASWNQAVSRDFSFNIGGNITFQKNKVISLSADLPNGVIDQTSTNNGEAISEMKPGMPIGYFKGYVVTGVFQTYNHILSSPSQASLGTSRPGDLIYQDVNGDKVVNSSDRTMIGNPTPKFYYGTSVNLTYKGFNLALDLGGVYGNNVYRTWGALESPFQRVNYAAFELARWHGAGTSNWVPLLSQGDRINYVGSTYSIEDGSYFRIRNVQLGYNFPRNMLSGIKLTNLRAFVNVQNLKTWKNNSGYTAEFGGSANQFGYDNGGGAIPVVTTFGLNLTF